MATCVSLFFVLHRNAAIAAQEQSTNFISRFLGPTESLPFHEACQFGSTALLDWIWGATCTSVAERTRDWSLNNYLRSDSHYHQWQFSRSLEVAAGRGDLRMVKWLFRHFSGCEAPASVAHEAKREGYLLVLRFLWEHRSGNVRQDAVGQGRKKGESTVRFDPDDKLLEAGTIQKACENGQLSQCLSEGMLLTEPEEEIAIKHALSIGQFELARRVLPPGRCILDYAADCPRIEVIEQLLDCGYLLRDERLAASAIPHLARSGRLDFVQRLVQLHSPLQKHHEHWVDTWIDAAKVACRAGCLPVLQWLVEHSLWAEVCRDTKNSRKIAFLFPDAAERGHADIMDFLFSHRLAQQVHCAMDLAVYEGQLSSVKWLLEHCSWDKLQLESEMITTCVANGYLKILKLFHELDVSPMSCEKTGAKRRRVNRRYSMWKHAHSLMYWAANGGHLDILEWLQSNRVQGSDCSTMNIAAREGHLDVVKWLHRNRSEGCTHLAIDDAATNGHLEVVEWLHTNRSEGCSARAWNGAVKNGHLEVVKWLYENIADARTDTLISEAVSRGHYDIACWLQARFPDYEIEGLGARVLFQESVDTFGTLLFLHERCNYVFTPQFLKDLRWELAWPVVGKNDSIPCIKMWMDKHYPSTSP